MSHTTSNLAEERLKLYTHTLANAKGALSSQDMPVTDSISSGKDFSVPNAKQILHYRSYLKDVSKLFFN